MHELIVAALETSAKVKIDLKTGVTLIEKIAKTFIETLELGNKILLCGNGGSAADAQHIACELIAKLKHHRKALPAIALTTNTSILTAVANDNAFEEIFARQVEALGKPGDVLVGISTSGNSPNVLKAVHTAKEKRLKTIGLTGAKGDRLASITDICIKVPSDDTQRIQEAHITIGHIICQIVEEHFVKNR